MAAIDTGAVTQQITDLAKTSVQEYAQTAAQDGVNLLANSQGLLQSYSDQLARGEIDQDELENDLSQDLLALATMDGLVEQGLAQIRVDAFAQQVVTLLIRAAVVAAVAAI